MKKKPLIELDLTLPSGREVHAVCYSIQPAEPDVGIMGSYIDDYAVFENGQLVKDFSDAEDDFVIEQFFEELSALEYDEDPRDELHEED